MKTPTWSYIVGILMMFFGGCSVLNNVQGTQPPKSIQEQLEVNNKVMEKFNIENGRKIDPDSVAAAFDSLAVQLDSLKDVDLDNPFANKMLDIADQVINMSEFTKTWLVRFAYIGLVLGFLYVIGGLLLIVPKRFSVKVAIAALVLSILFGIARPVILASDPSGSAFSLLTGIGGIFGILIDIVLLIIILASNKAVYRGDYEPDPADGYI